MMKLGFETIVWGRRIDDLDHLLAVLSASGYEGVEFGQNHRDIYVREGGTAQPIGTLQRLKERLNAHGLTLIGLVGGTLKERMKFCGNDRSIYLYLDSWSDANVEALESSSPFTLALHPHWFMPVRRLSQVETILAEVQNPNLKVIIDTAHAIIAEDDPIVAVERHVAHLAAVHIKDWKPDFGRWSHRYAHGFCPPDQGIVPLEKVLYTLHRLKYDRWVVLEQDYFETSREQTALACATWAMKWAGNYFRSFSPNAQSVELLEARRPRSLFQPTASQISEEVLMARQLILAPARGPDVFYPLAVRLLRTAFSAEAVKLWNYNPITDEIYLLAASLAEHLPQHCHVKRSRKRSLAATVIEESRALVHDLHDPAIQSRFADQTLLKSLKSRWMLVVPIFNSSNAHHIRSILSVFLGSELRLVDGELMDSERRFFEHYGDLLSVWADYLTDEMCSAAAGATAHLCGEVRTGVIPFVNALMAHVERLFPCERATIFLVDESRTRLEPVGATEDRIEWGEHLPKHERFYHKGEGLTGRTWQQREMLFSSDAHKGKSFEKTSSPRREALTAPLVRRGGDLLGVIRLHNKIPRKLSPAATAFTDDDTAKLDAVIQTALPHLDLLIKQRRQSFALTRLAHELQNPLVGIAGAADFLRERLKARRITDIRKELGADYIDDILSYQALMSRLVDNANLFGSIIDELKPKFEHTDMATMVVIPVRNQLKALLKKHRLPEDRIYVAQFQGVVPWLEVDRSMFQQVFFNLFVNAIKYHAGADSFCVEVKVRVEGEPKNPSHYLIEVEDWGMGLDDGDQTGETLFLPGVRGKHTSQHRDVSGMGIGLAVVKAVINAHCGTVEFSSPRKPTRVTIRLPSALRHMSPKLIRSQPLQEQ